MEKEGDRLRRKKRLWAAVSVAILGIFAAVLVVGFSGSSAEKKYTIVIDAGHGYPDGGATGINTGTCEAEINLLIAQSVKSYFESSDFRVVMTREGANGLYSGDGNFKKGDMLKRRDVIHRAKPDFVVSIHLNKFTQSYRKGAQVFFKASDENGKRLADSIQSVLNKNLNERAFSALAGDYYMLNCSEYPSVIVECGFLSNPEEERLLLTEEYREKLAYNIYAGVIHYLF